MRLDSFLSTVGIVKRRTEAARLLREGRVFVDERAVKPAAEVRVGARIRVDGARGGTLWKVLEIPTGNVAKANYGRYVARSEEEPRGDA